MIFNTTLRVDYCIGIVILSLCMGCYESREKTNATLKAAVESLQNNPHDLDAKTVISGYLKNGTSFQKMKACYAVGELRLDGAFALHDVLPLSLTSESPIRPQAVAALGKIAPNNDEAFDAVVHNLHHPMLDSRNSIRATDAMILFKNHREKAISNLKSAQQHQNSSTAKAAGFALKGIMDEQ